jgi:hypothetical protein
MLSIFLLGAPVISVDGRPLDTLRRKNRALVNHLARRAAAASRDEDGDTNNSPFDKGHLTDGNTWNIIVSIRYPAPSTTCPRAG